MREVREKLIHEHLPNSGRKLPPPATHRQYTDKTENKECRLLKHEQVLFFISEI